MGGGKAVAKAVKKMVKSGAWRTFLPGNNPWYDENPSDEQDAMKEEVSGTSPHHHHHKFDPSKCPPGKICDESPSDEPDAMKEGVGTSPHHHHHKFDPNSVFDPSKCPPGKVCDESPSDEQDAMNEVSGTEKGLASNIKKGGKAAAKA